MSLFAADAYVGAPRVPLPYGNVPELPDLLAEMECLGVGRALVRWRRSLEAGARPGNEEMLAALAPHPALMPCALVSPDGVAPDFAVSAELDRLAAFGVRAFWMAPAFDNYDPLPWCAGPLYSEIEQRGYLLLVDYRQAGPREIDSILTTHPRLRLLYLGVPRLGRHRAVYPLLERHPGLRVCLSQSWSAPGLIEDLVARFGSKRFVFGAGYPEAEGGSAVMGLAYAKISEADRARIASENLEALLDGSEPA